MTTAALAATDLTFGYEPATPVLRGVTASIPAGSIVGILGPNGSGKTTLLRLLAGLMRPWQGRVTLDGVELRTLPRDAVARRIAVVPQETHLAFDYSVLEMATMGRYPHLSGFAIEGPDDLAIARDALNATGTLAFESRMFNTLSGGEKQRVVIASALAQTPGVLLLDEPTASLDLAYQLEVRSVLLNLNRSRGLTIVISTHDLNLAASLCTELILVSRGRVLAAGPVAGTLTPALMGELYEVEVDITMNARTGLPSVVPIARL